jgi:hypothetical protein
MGYDFGIHVSGLIDRYTQTEKLGIREQIFCQTCNALSEVGPVLVFVQA